MSQRTREKKEINFRGLFSPLLCHLNLSAAFKLNKTSMAPLQNMVISPLHETWKKKRGGSFSGSKQKHHSACTLSFITKRGCFQEEWMKGWWVTLLGCLGHAELAGCWKTQSWTRWGFSNFGTEEFYCIISSCLVQLLPGKEKLQL